MGRGPAAWSVLRVGAQSGNTVFSCGVLGQPALPRKNRRPPFCYGRSVRVVVSLGLVCARRFWRWLRRPCGCGGFVSLILFCPCPAAAAVVSFGFCSAAGVFYGGFVFDFVSRLVLVLGVLAGAKKAGARNSDPLPPEKAEFRCTHRDHGNFAGGATCLLGRSGRRYLRRSEIRL